MEALTVEINESDILKILQSENLTSFESFKITPLSDKVLGLWGDHFILQIETKSKNFKFFLKAIPRHNEKRLEFITKTGFFQRECEIYENFIPKLSNFSSLKWSVKCLMVKSEHFIVLENLKNFKLLEVDPMLLDLDHCVVRNWEKF